LTENDVQFERRGVSNILVKTTAKKASRLLRTNFNNIYHKTSKRAVVRAGDYHLPDDVHEAVAGVFGLHGLPLPLRAQPVHVQLQSKAEIVSVTPTVLQTTYAISGVTPSHRWTEIKSD
jgi:hypothetical protein